MNLVQVFRTDGEEGSGDRERMTEVTYIDQAEDSQGWKWVA